jgi:hypothetical protein
LIIDSVSIDKGVNLLIKYTFTEFNLFNLQYLKNKIIPPCEPSSIHGVYVVENTGGVSATSVTVTTIVAVPTPALLSSALDKKKCQKNVKKTALLL